nr:transposase [Thomasclavelia spiroformis]
MDIFDTFVRIKKHTLPRVLLIDKFHFSRSTKYKYPSILMNFKNNLIVDIVVESRTHDIMSDYFFKISLEKKKVEYICTDMNFVFKPLLKTYFPNSTLLIDHFHVIRLINNRLNHTRKRIMRKYAQNKKSLEYRLLKH